MKNDFHVIVFWADCPTGAMLGDDVSNFQKVDGNIGVQNFEIANQGGNLNSCKETCLVTAGCRSIEYSDPDSDGDGVCVVKSATPFDLGVAILVSRNGDTFIRTCIAAPWLFFLLLRYSIAILKY